MKYTGLAIVIAWASLALGPPAQAQDTHPGTAQPYRKWDIGGGVGFACCSNDEDVALPSGGFEAQVCRGGGRGDRAYRGGGIARGLTDAPEKIGPYEKGSIGEHPTLQRRRERPMPARICRNSGNGRSKRGAVGHGIDRPLGGLTARTAGSYPCQAEGGVAYGHGRCSETNASPN